MAEFVLGIDYGSTVIKAGVFGMQGEEKGVCSVKVDNTSPKTGWYERDLEGVWESSKAAIAGAVKAASESCGISAADIAAVSLTGHGNGAHLVDGNGGGTRPAIESTDNRAASYVEQWKKDGSAGRIHPMNMQALWPAHSLCVMAWLRDHERDVLDKTKWILNPKDFIRLRLTGEAFLEYSDASGSGLINTRDRKIDPAMLDMAGLGFLAEKLPPLRYATDLCGSITGAAAAETGLKAGTPVAAGCYDIDSAGLATGLADESLMNVIVGSWANNQFISRTPLVSEDFFSTTVYAIEGYYLMLEGSATGAINLEWFVERFMEADKALAKQAGKKVYALCDEAAASVKPEASRIIFLPFLYGSNVNFKATGTLLGMEGSHTRAEVIRAFFEGICFTHRYHIEKMASYGRVPEIARMAGGAVKSDVWRQMFADVLQKPVEVTAATELGTLGAAMCAAVLAGAYPGLPEAAKKMVQVTGRTEPNPGLFDVYTRKYQSYKRAIEALDSYWNEE
ncbi:MAG: carbohydrate kinase [Treponema sp.]|jgi:L-xylulokinase|nr:carbohydrate kinase [Treponema sp.]